MDGYKAIDGFHLDNNCRSNHKVDSVSGIQHDAFVFDWQGKLPADIKPAARQFMSEAVLISRFKQTGAQDGMYS
jgi:hypothetical protein